MQSYKCGVCGYVYDPQKGVPEMGIPPGTPFEELPDDFECPICGADKESFALEEPAGADASKEESVELATTIQAIIPRTPTVKSFRLAAQRPAAFKPGQYLKITLEGEAALTKCLSISSSPTEEGYLEVTKRITDSRFSQILAAAQPGYAVKISYPHGSFTFTGECEKIALLSGGIGITPLRSICRYAVDRRLPTSICLLYSNRTAEEIVFKSELAAMTPSAPNLKVVHTLGRAGAEWSGRKGRIDAQLVKEEIPDYLERRFYVCGPPQMVALLTAMLQRELGVPKAQVWAEDFLGY